MEKLTQIKFFKRWNNQARLIEENLPEHCYYTALAGIALCERLDIQMPMKMMKHILTHDSGELVYGDIPYTAKQSHPELKRVTDEIEDSLGKEDIRGFMVNVGDKWYNTYNLFKICDELSALIYMRMCTSFGTHISTYEATEKSLALRLFSIGLCKEDIDKLINDMEAML